MPDPNSRMMIVVAVRVRVDFALGVNVLVGVQQAGPPE